MVSRIVGLLTVSLVVAGCGGTGHQSAKDSITEEELIEDIRVLASDDFQGRFPGTPGGEKTEQFLRDRFEGLGLQPGNGESYFQRVPLVEITAAPSADLVVSAAGRTVTFDYGSDFVGGTRRVVDAVQVDQSDVVFVGYGIVAPEYGWDDYADVDVAGKTVVMLVNDPGFATKDESLFRGNTMTYYGRWTYKFEEAARQGADAAIIVHETEAAGYPWSVVEGGWSGSQSYLLSSDNNMSRSAVEGWMSTEAASTLFRMAGQDFDAAKASAVEQPFRSQPLGLSASVSVQNTIRRSGGNNVLALLPGKTRPNEIIVFMAHQDH
ncbi:MAG: M28 family metallopeptidase, partial [Rhodothermales bacterium]|nr:M28 family metallopeptidase [Rhodothermales bacterium]